MLHIGWRQIYEGYDMVLVGKIKEALEGENIDYKVEADNPARSRMSRDVLFGEILWCSMVSVQEQ